MRVRPFVMVCGALAATFPALVTPVRACSLAGNQPLVISPLASPGAVVAVLLVAAGLLRRCSRASAHRP